MGGMLPTLSWPDLLVGPGLLGGSMILSLEQLFIDVEVFRHYRRAYQGIDGSEDRWLEEVIDRAGPGGEFLSERSTVTGMRGGEWYVSRLGVHEPYEGWVAAGQPTLLEEAAEKVRQLLASHEPLPLEPEVERELDRIQKRARAEA
jgi:trimethylamine--corrinoid protein Co-methyltransferase